MAFSDGQVGSDLALFVVSVFGYEGDRFVDPAGTEEGDGEQAAVISRGQPLSE